MNGFGWNTTTEDNPVAYLGERRAMSAKDQLRFANAVIERLGWEDRDLGPELRPDEAAAIMGETMDYLLEIGEIDEPPEGEVWDELGMETFRVALVCIGVADILGKKHSALAAVRRSQKAKKARK